ncbi:hypothetical protein ACFYW6_34015 [Streptomyces sp. NPDC002659]|uniref:hypothetical protein n=1 Tax=Streptomyces sp. NPDC002659 TaxID=3364656 RepID=UPI0036AD0D42
MPQDLDQALQDWATRATDAELEAGPTLDDLGGPEAVITEATAMASGPNLPYLLQALAHAADTVDAAQADALYAAARHGLEHPHAAWVLADALDVLCTSPPLLARLAQPAALTLTRHAEAALTATGPPELAQPAIAGLLRLALAGGNHRRLLLLLTEITGTEPVAALERLPILIGVAHDQYQDCGLLSILTALENQPDLPPATRADASFELALATLQQAFTATDPATIEQHLRTALVRLTTLDREHENRLDARAYAAAIDAVLAFTDSTHHPGSTDVRARVNAAADRLEATVTQLTAWTSGLHHLDWLSARGSTRTAWSRLIVTLRAAAKDLAEPSWYAAADALNRVLDIYQASRTIHSFATGADAAGLEVLIAPAIEASFLRNEGLLHQLEQALATDPQFTDHPDALTLHEAIRARQNSPAPTQGVMPGKALEGRPELAALFTDNGTALRDDIAPDTLDQAERYLHHARRGYAPTGNAQFDTRMEQLLERLEDSPNWKPPVLHQFTGLLDQFLRFLYDRFDAQADRYGDRTAYLGPPKPNIKAWSEKALQDDLLQQLSAVMTPDTVRRELIDVASGRTDITYTPQPGNRYVIEVKRRLTSATREAVERDYLGQAANYTATGPPFGILAIGDHSDHRSGYSDLEDRVWIIQHARSPTEVPRLIVAGVLPIGRPTPSALRADRTNDK